MELTFDDIIRALESIGIDHKLLGKNEAITGKSFRMASTKSKIKGGIYFLTEEYITECESISNSVILLNGGSPNNSSNIYILVNNPQLAHYKLAGIFEEKIEPGIHPTAIVDNSAKVHPSAHIGPYCILKKCEIGENVALLSHVTVNDNVTIGKNTVIEGHSVIGARGMAWIWDDNGERVMQPQLGGVVIGEDCLIGTDITIVRGSMTESTIIGKGTVMAHGTKIGHGCRIGNAVHFANNVSLAGNVVLHDRAFLGSGAVVASNVQVAEGCIVGAGAVVNKTVTEKFATLAGVPAKIIKINNFEYKPKGVPKPYK